MLSPLFSIFTQKHLPDIQGGVSFEPLGTVTNGPLICLCKKHLDMMT